ncbi:hypothetical protein FACS1894202_12380 [Clostridia bacterium]|nr:hypothetical protein FACS1894202_12380 [Clostridia bacterium]
MDKFTLIYKILRFIELAADQDEFDTDAFSEKRFGVTRNEFLNAIEMLKDAGYIKGIELRESVDWRVGLFVTWPKLTLDGLKYLATDELMKKEAQNAKAFNVRALT